MVVDKASTGNCIISKGLKGNDTVMYGFAHPVVDEYDEMSAPKNVEGRRIPCGASSYAGPFTVKYTEQQDDYNVFRDDVQMYSYWWQKSANYKIQSIYDNGILFICGEAGCFFQ